MTNSKLWFDSMIFKAVLVNTLYKCLAAALSNTQPQIFVNRCIQENPPFSPKYIPYTILSLCHLNGKESTLLQQETARAKPLPRFSHHSYSIRFANIATLEEAIIFQSLYERLFIPSAQRELFQYIGSKYREFWQYNAHEVKLELLRSRWNLDEFVLLNSPGALRLLDYENQLPTFLQSQDERYKTNNVSDLQLIYYITSGYGQRCVHYSWDHKLASLTYDFTSYDRIFCDAFEYHGLQHSIGGYWNLGDMYYPYFRVRLIRDGMVSYFPPDRSLAVYYASPQLTFVVLQRKPITWLFVVRPFTIPLWIFLIVTFMVMEFIRYLNQIIDFYHQIKLKRRIIKQKLFAIIVREYDEGKLEEIGNRYQNMLRIFNGLMRIMLASAYGGMILVGILHPLKPWTPYTFTDLNNTKNYFVGTAEYSPYFVGINLVDRFKLNNLERKMMIIRKRPSPAEYLEFSVTSNFTSDNPDKFYAAIMYDDKMNLWTKGRFFIYNTAPFLGRMKPATEKVLPEIRYVSIAAGATRLRFLMVTLQRVFTSGTWMRWYYLEQNYYKNVAPIIAAYKVKERGMAQPKDEHEYRPLHLLDLFSVFAIKSIGLAVSFLVCMFELYTECSYSQVI